MHQRGAGHRSCGARIDFGDDAAEKLASCLSPVPRTRASGVVAGGEPGNGRGKLAWIFHGPRPDLPSEAGFALFFDILSYEKMPKPVRCAA